MHIWRINIYIYIYIYIYLYIYIWSSGNEWCFLLTIDIEKAFDSVKHHFLIAILKEYENEFIGCIKVLINNQELCVINGGKTSKYFKLERGTQQGGPISAYLSLCLK